MSLGLPYVSSWIKEVASWKNLNLLKVSNMGSRKILRPHSCSSVSAWVALASPLFLNWLLFESLTYRASGHFSDARGHFLGIHKIACEKGHLCKYPEGLDGNVHLWGRPPSHTSFFLRTLQFLTDPCWSTSHSAKTPVDTPYGISASHILVCEMKNDGGR